MEAVSKRPIQFSIDVVEHIKDGPAWIERDFIFLKLLRLVARGALPIDLDSGDILVQEISPFMLGAIWAGRR